MSKTKLVADILTLISILALPGAISQGMDFWGIIGYLIGIPLIRKAVFLTGSRIRNDKPDEPPRQIERVPLTTTRPVTGINWMTQEQKDEFRKICNSKDI